MFGWLLKIFDAEDWWYKKRTGRSMYKGYESRPEFKNTQPTRLDREEKKDRAIMAAIKESGVLRQTDWPQHPSPEQLQEAKRRMAELQNRSVEAGVQALTRDGVHNLFRSAMEGETTKTPAPVTLNDLTKPLEEFWDKLPPEVREKARKDIIEAQKRKEEEWAYAALQEGSQFPYTTYSKSKQRLVEVEGRDGTIFGWRQRTDEDPDPYWKRQPDPLPFPAGPPKEGDVVKVVGTDKVMRRNYKGEWVLEDANKPAMPVDRGWTCLGRGPMYVHEWQGACNQMNPPDAKYCVRCGASEISQSHLRDLRRSNDERSRKEPLPTLRGV